MAVERSLGIIKPDAVANNYVGKILAHASGAGLQIKALRMLQMTKRDAEQFYAVHKDRPFFGELVDFMTEGPCVVVVFEGENAIKTWRDTMGATNPAEAAEGTIRKLYAESFTRNSSHGSDAPETAAVEVPFFFAEKNIF